MIGRKLSIACAFLAASIVSASAEWSAEATAGVNVRSGAGVGYRVVATIPAYEVVNVNFCTGNWCNVDYAGVKGYASRRFLRQVSAITVRPRGNFPPRVSSSNLGFEYDAPFERELITKRDPNFRWGWGNNPGPFATRPNGF